ATGDVGTSEIILWDVATSKPRLTLRSGNHDVTSLAYSPDGKVLASGGQRDGVVRLWHCTTGKQLATLEWHKDSVWAVCFTPDGRGIVTAGADRTVRLWDAATYRGTRTFQTDSVPYAVAFGRRDCLAVACEDGTITLLPVGK